MTPEQQWYRPNGAGDGWETVWLAAGDEPGDGWVDEVPWTVDPLDLIRDETT